MQDPRGALTVVGTGFQVAGQVTAEAIAEIRRAERLFFVVGDPTTRQWLEGLNPRAESLYDAYAPGRPRRESYATMAERMLAPVREGLHVCAAFYGHPGVFVQPSHAAIRTARSEGYRARMLPAVSAEDCLFADLAVDPGVLGCQSYEATHFVLNNPTFDPGSALVLWQIGAVGVRTFKTARLWSRSGLALLAEVLSESYPPDHEVVVYEAADLPLCSSRIDRLPLTDLASAEVTTGSTLCVPPAQRANESPANRVETQEGSLTLVGTGHNLAGQIDTQTLNVMRRADRLFYLLSDPLVGPFLRSLNPTATDLRGDEHPDEASGQTSQTIVERLLGPANEGLDVCAAFSGHPAIGVLPAHRALRRARAEGRRARMLPAVSLEDCLIADLGVDPATFGRTIYQATAFLARPRAINTTATLVLLQVGTIASTHGQGRYQPNQRGLRALVEVLATHYDTDQPVTIYEVSPLPFLPPRIDTVPLGTLADATMTIHSILYIPPARRPRADPGRRARLAALP